MCEKDESRQYSSCLVGGLRVGVDVNDVQEVSPISELTPVPLAPPFVSGLLNLRGDIVTAFDLRRRLQIDAPPADRPPVNLIVRTADGCVSLLVDQVGDVIEVAGEAIEPPPPSLPAPLRDVATGVCKLEDGLMLLLDTDAVLVVPDGSAGQVEGRDDEER